MNRLAAIFFILVLPGCNVAWLGSWFSTPSTTWEQEREFRERIERNHAEF